MSIRPALADMALPDRVRRGFDDVFAAPPLALPLTLGSASIDARLAGRLPRAALHEVFAESAQDGCSATGFALLLAIRASNDKPILYVREDRGVRRDGCLYPHGLAELGLDPARVLTVHAPDTQALLRASGDIVKCAEVGTVILEPQGKAPELDLTASRRLMLAAARSGVMTVVLRVDAVPVPSAAASRWSVSAAPSMALEADAPGHAAFDIALTRHKGGIPGFEARLEWNRDRNAFDESSLPGGFSAVPALGTGGMGRQRAA